MKLVIEIDERVYRGLQRIKDGKWHQNMDNIERAVANGRPLEDYLFPFDYKKGEKDAD